METNKKKTKIGDGRAKPRTKKQLSQMKKARTKAQQARIGSKHTLKSIKQISESRKGKCRREQNPRWNGGIGIYQQLISKKACSECGSKDKLIIHHIDKDRHNNIISNLKVVCTKCHCKIHEHFNRW